MIGCAPGNGDKPLRYENQPRPEYAAESVSQNEKSGPCYATVTSLVPPSLNNYCYARALRSNARAMLY